MMSSVKTNRSVTWQDDSGTVFMELKEVEGTPAIFIGHPLGLRVQISLEDACRLHYALQEAIDEINDEVQEERDVENWDGLWGDDDRGDNHQYDGGAE
jgi:hypothetical protein